MPGRSCDAPGCGIGHDSHGYCSRHMHRWRRYGPVSPIAPKRLGDDERFHSWVTIDPRGCWRWQGFLTPGGYGDFKAGGRSNRAHVWAYKRWRGEIPEGLQLDHLCRVRDCVNPDHLEAVTQYENNLRSNSPVAVNSRREVCVNGHPFDTANTYIATNQVNPRRQCKACNRARTRRWLAARALNGGQ